MESLQRPEVIENRRLKRELSQKVALYETCREIPNNRSDVNSTAIIITEPH